MPKTKTWGNVLAVVALSAATALTGCGGDGSPEDAGDGGTQTAEAAAPAAPETPEPDPSRWLLVEGAGPDGTGSGVEVVREAFRGANSIGTPPTIHIRCEAGDTRLTIVWYEDPEGRDNDVTTTLDGATSVRRNWTNVNEDASYFPVDSTVAFVQRLIESDTLVVESNLYKRWPIEAAFALDRLSEEIAPVREACGW